MIVKIGKEAPRALELFSFFAHHLDPSCGAVVCDQKFLADRFEWTEKRLVVGLMI